MDDRWQIDRSGLGHELERVRERMGDARESAFADEADATFNNDPAEVLAWLRLAEGQARSGNFLPPPRPTDPEFQTLYLEMNGFDFNPDRWSFDAFGCGSPPPEGLTVIGTAFDAVVGYFIGDVAVDSYTLTGMEGLQTVFADVRGRNVDDPAEPHAVELVRLAWFDLLDTAMRQPDPPRVRIAAAVHDEELFAVWEARPTSPGM